MSRLSQQVRVASGYRHGMHYDMEVIGYIVSVYGIGNTRKARVLVDGIWIELACCDLSEPARAKVHAGAKCVFERDSVECLLKLLTIDETRAGADVSGRQAQLKPKEYPITSRRTPPHATSAQNSWEKAIGIAMAASGEQACQALASGEYWIVACDNMIAIVCDEKGLKAVGRCVTIQLRQFDIISDVEIDAQGFLRQHRAIPGRRFIPGNKSERERLLTDVIEDQLEVDVRRGIGKLRQLALIEELAVLSAPLNVLLDTYDMLRKYAIPNSDLTGIARELCNIVRAILYARTGCVLSTASPSAQRKEEGYRGGLVSATGELTTFLSDALAAILNRYETGVSMRVAELRNGVGSVMGSKKQSDKKQGNMKSHGEEV